jgi:hypothetical protein
MSKDRGACNEASNASRTFLAHVVAAWSRLKMTALHVKSLHLLRYKYIYRKCGAARREVRDACRGESDCGGAAR